jgi:hypothetical protein
MAISTGAGKVANLDADKLDGRDASDFAAPLFVRYSPRLAPNRPAIGSLPPFNSRRTFAILDPSSQLIITRTER